LERTACTNKKFHPVLRFYAFPKVRDASLLQGNTPTGAKQLNSVSFLGLHGAQTLVSKPDGTDANSFNWQEVQQG
jgi:hypothetical protein